MNLADVSDSEPVTLLLDGERPRVCTLGELREALGGPEERPRLVTTTKASELWSYSPEWWAREAREGRIEGAVQDGDGGIWRLPRASCVARIERKRNATSDEHRRRREPWGPAPSQASHSRPEDLPARKLTLLEGGPSAVGRGEARDEEPRGPRLAGEGRADGTRGDC